MHISDLHIGKRVNEYSMLEDQAHILAQIIDIAKKRTPDAILIAGDIYDKSQPSTEAVVLLDDFLTQLTALTIPIFIISGNHDSPQRLGFGNRLLQKNQLYIASVFQGSLESVTLQDEYGDVHIHMLPFIKPAMLKPFFEESFDSYDAALRGVINAGEIDTTKRNVLISHQFVISGSKQPIRSDSEQITVGGLDQIDASAFDAFDYVALGHLHGPQRVGRDTIRYCGSPLKYSFSEVHQKKSVVMIELQEKEHTSIDMIPLLPLRDMREIKGPIASLLSLGKQDKAGSLDYIHATLTDEEDIYDALGQLREVYPNLMVLDFENSRTKASSHTSGERLDLSKKSPFDLFSEFYVLQNNVAMSQEQQTIVTDILQQIGEDDS